MRRTLYALAALALATAAVSGCKKDDESEIRAAPKYGAIRFKNMSADLYDIFIDNNRMGNLYGGDSATYYNITPAPHTVSAKQTANIVGSPTYRSYTVYLKADSLATFSFP